ncbi:hypothetical protein C5167_032944 [Papaver somniferum]|uniref:Uncharacterized protein n=1 Tax=Papaver somniferum TaxID=3469 RepID=A0A4Y7KCX0_PAPSO|nr:hypothetical protein C5167_032944 [Papaver somniferum]
MVLHELSSGNLDLLVGPYPTHKVESVTLEVRKSGLSQLVSEYGSNLLGLLLWHPTTGGYPGKTVRGTILVCLPE